MVENPILCYNENTRRNVYAKRFHDNFFINSVMY